MSGADQPARTARKRRAAGALLLLVGAGGLAGLHRWATDFPVAAAPIHEVDAALVADLRERPGLHLPLAPDYALVTELDLADDPLNRWVYGTRVDLRERRAERSIHIQIKGGRGAIHADETNPQAGAWAWLVHATVDVPATPFMAAAAIGLALLAWPTRRF